MEEPLSRKELRENCGARHQYVLGKGKKKFVCLNFDKDCNSKTRCPIMDRYDRENGIEHKGNIGDDFYDNFIDIQDD